MVNTALLTDLEAGTTYYYTFGDAGLTSPEFFFVGPKPPSASASLHLVAFGGAVVSTVLMHRIVLSPTTL